jgi:hypothetical protein
VCPKNAMPRPRHSRSDALRLPRTIRFIPRPGISVSSIAIVSPAELPAEGPAELPAEGPAEGPAELPAEGPAEGPAELHALHAHAQSGAEGPAAPCPPPPAVAPAAGSTTRPLRKRLPPGISHTAAAPTRAWDTEPFPNMPHACSVMQKKRLSVWKITLAVLLSTHMNPRLWRLTSAMNLSPLTSPDCGTHASEQADKIRAGTTAANQSSQLEQPMQIQIHHQSSHQSWHQSSPSTERTHREHLIVEGVVAANHVLVARLCWRHVAHLRGVTRRKVRQEVSFLCLNAQTMFEAMFERAGCPPASRSRHRPRHTWAGLRCPAGTP